MMTMKTSSRLLVWLGALTLCGCSSFSGLRGDGFARPVQELSAWSKNLRGRDPSLSPFGASSKARQIESSLGAE